jgi:VRR-NUC domain
MIPLTETEFQRQVTDLAEILGWQWVHFRPAQTSRGWRTPVSGPLGKGWPDLVLVRERDRRLLFIELKAGKGKTTPEQNRVFEALYWLQTEGCFASDGTRLGGTRIAVHRWWPQHWDEIEAVLR